MLADTLTTLGDWPVYNPNTRPPNWLTVFNQSVGLASQAISAWGHNPSTQVGQQYSGGVFTIQAIRPAYDDTTAYYRNVQSNPYAGLNAQQLAVLTAQRGGVAEDALGSLGNFVSAHPLMVFGGIAAVYLLMSEPPRRR